VDGDKEIKFTDLKAGMRVTLQLAADQRGLVIVGIRIDDKDGDGKQPRKEGAKPEREQALWDEKELQAKRVVTLEPAVKGNPGIRSFILCKGETASLWFSVCLMPRMARIGFSSSPDEERDCIQDDYHPLVILGEKAPKIADLKKGIPVSPALFVDLASEIIVDRVVKAVQKNEDNTTTLELTVSTLATVEKLAIDGIFPAKEIKVVIGGKPGNLTDLKAGVSISMRVAKATEPEAVVEIRARKAVESLNAAQT
jgi:hypothetical protein